MRNPFKIENLFALNHNIPGYGTLDHFMMTHEWARVAGRAAATFFAGWFGPWAAAGANAMITGYEVWLAGGSSQDIHKAAAISFATSMAFNFVGDGASAIAKTGNAGGAIAFKIVGHAAVGCASASASGGDCGQGALSAGIGAATTVATRGMHPSGQFVLTVVAGGIGAELGGGKFANGAMTAAMGYLTNEVLHMGGTARVPQWLGRLVMGKEFTGQGISVGIAFSYPGLTGGRSDIGFYFTAMGGGDQIDIGTPYFGFDFSVSRGDVQGMRGQGVQFTFNDGIGGLTFSFQNGAVVPSGVGLQLGPGLLLQGAGTVTKVGSMRDLTDPIFGK